MEPRMVRHIAIPFAGYEYPPSSYSRFANSGWLLTLPDGRARCPRGAIRVGTQTRFEKEHLYATVVRKIQRALPAVAGLLLVVSVSFLMAVPMTPTSAPRTLRGEMKKIFEAYLKISEDAEEGTNQTRDKFCYHVACRYNAGQPAGTVERNESMVCNVIRKANKEIQMFQGITSRNNGRQGAARAMSTSPRPPCRPTNQCITNHSNISTLGRRCVIIQSIREASDPLPAPPANGQVRYPYLTLVRTRSQASDGDHLDSPDVGARKEIGDDQPPSHRDPSLIAGSRSLCAASTLHQQFVGHFVSPLTLIRLG